MRIAVFGSGGVGGYFGGRLAEAGETVTFIARGAHLAALLERGLAVESIAGDFEVRPVRATDDPRTVGVVDAVLVAVKTWQLGDAARAMAPLVGPATMVVPLENGVEAPEELGQVLGAEHVLGGLCRILAYVVGPGRIRHSAVEPYVAFGELDGSPSPRAESLLAAFRGATGVVAEIPDDIRAAMWGKFMFITPVSSIGAVTRVPIGAFRATSETRALLHEALREIEALARHLGVRLPADAVGQTLEFVDAIPPDGTTSMQRDIMDGRPSELEAQVGAVVRLGARAGVAVPVHQFLYAALLPQERRVRGESSGDS